MAQTYNDDVYASTHVAATDLQNIENNFAALKSSFSGTSSPSNVVGGMPWHDSTARKIRNYANSAWLVSLMGDASQKMWVYRNNTCEGWLIYTSIGDVVLGVKGGSRAYNVNGGNLAGSWTVEGLTHSHSHTHNHQWYDDSVDAQSIPNDGTWNSAGTRITIPYASNIEHQGVRYQIVPNGYAQSSIGDCYTDNDATPPNSSAVPSDATWRPRAAVGTLQYPDLS